MSIQDYIVTCFEYIFVLLQVLVEHGQSRKIVTVLENEKLKHAIKKSFGINIKDSDINMQVYNDEWKEYIDVDDEEQVPDRAKVRIVEKVFEIVNSYRRKFNR